MTWLKVDDGFAEHPKVLELDDATFRLHVRAMCWCSRQETDGAVTKAAQRALGAKPKQVATLVRVGLWDPTEDGHTIHDYLVYNPSKAKLEADRAIANRRAGLRSDPNLMRLVKERDGNQCRYCARTVNWDDRRGALGGTYDHVIPISRGGSDEMTNIVVACRECNSGKGGRTLEEWGRPLRPPPGTKTLPAHDQVTTGKNLVTRPGPSRSDLTEPVFQRPESLKPPDTPAAAEAAPNKPIPCPSDLRLLPGQTSSLEIAPGIPAESQEIMRSEFVAAELADPSKTMPLVAWRKCLSKAMCSRWSDPKRRPKPAESEPEDDGPKLPPGAGKRRLERMERERKEEIRRRAAEFEARGGKLPESIQALTEGIGG